MQPAPAPVDAVEILSQVLTGSRIQGRLLCHKVFRGDWGLSFPLRAGARFHLLVQGRCWLRHPDLPTYRELEPGELILISQAGSHELVGNPGNPVVNVDTLSNAEVWGPAHGGLSPARPSDSYLICGDFTWDSVQFPPLFDALPSVVSIKGHEGRPIAWLTPLLELLSAEGKSTRSGQGILVERYLEILLILVLRQLLKDSRTLSSPRWFQALAHPQVARALALIHTTPESAWTLNTLAEAAGSSRAAFSKQFSTLGGQSPMRYLTWWRMQTARILLKSHGLRLEEAAARIGYASVYSFSKAFKQAFGEPPGRFRDGNAEASFAVLGG